MAQLTDTIQPPAPTLNASHLHECAVCEVTLICVCNDKRQVDRATGKPRRLLCVTCGEIAEGMRELERAEQQAARQPL
jgi:hypothetical protein